MNILKELAEILSKELKGKNLSIGEVMTHYSRLNCYRDIRFLLASTYTNEVLAYMETNNMIKVSKKNIGKTYTIDFLTGKKKLTDTIIKYHEF